MTAGGSGNAWRFLHPDLDVADTVGLVVGHTGRLELVGGADAVRQALLLLLSTTPGERVMRPDYGCELLSLAFAPNDGTTAGLAIHYVRKAVERFEPRARVLGIDAGPNSDDPSRLDVTLDYSPGPGGPSRRLTIGLPMADGGSVGVGPPPSR